MASKFNFEKQLSRLEEIVAKLEEAGLSKYMEEWNRQRDEFLANK